MINTALLFNPLNWLIVIAMLMISSIALTVLAQLIRPELTEEK